ncbi:MAG: DUF423 domain-containing protein [Sneathiellales bacterium]|nr:DUF423 domain-containing protein [Sneathiellales bacterium]
MRLPWISIASVLGAIAVILAALGAHFVAGGEHVHRLHETANKLHMFHILPLAILGLLPATSKTVSLFATMSGIFVILGIGFFSGSLYFFAYSGIPVGFLITPAGGICFILGWICLAIAGFASWRQEIADQS